MVAGVVGRNTTYAQARRSTSLNDVGLSLGLADFFDEKLVRPFSALLLVFGLGTAWLQGWPILGSLQGGGVNWLFVSLILTLAITPLVIFVLLPESKLRHAALREAMSAGTITPDLATALRSRRVLVARWIEVGLLFVITALMVLKPF
jgi:hypothetical protein